MTLRRGCDGYIGVIWAVCLVLLAACGSSSGSRAGRPSSTVTTERVADVRAYTSRVVTKSPDILRQLIAAEPCMQMLSDLTGDHCTSSAQLALESAAALSAGLVDDLEEARTPSSPGYVGRPPSDVVGLVEVTITTGRQFSESVRDRAAACPGEKCSTMTGVVGARARYFTNSLRDWTTHT